MNKLLVRPKMKLNEIQAEMRATVLEDVGLASAVFDPKSCRAAVHHSDLLPLERRLVESVFRTKRERPDAGLDVIAATSTIAQGLNLPCDVVILAGTDRSVVDDPSGNPRKSLRPHEILNALGRAGRAAYAATGLSIVIPADPILVNLSYLDFPDPHPDLGTIFSEQDACEQILDPLERLLDQIETSAKSDGKVQAMIRRLSAVTQEGASGFDDIVQRSFGYFQRRNSNVVTADQWLKSRRLALAKAEEALGDPESLDWQHELAVRNGISPRLIARLADALLEVPDRLHSTADWLRWTLDIVANCPSDLPLFIRPAALEAVFGRAYQENDVSARLILSALKKLIEMWCAGVTLVEIEVWLLQWIRANEGKVKRQTSMSSKAHHARRFAIRITPDLSFLCGVLGQIAAHLYADVELSPLPMIDMLPQMVKNGDYDRHHMALRQNAPGASRVITYKTYEQHSAHFTKSSSMSFDSVRNEVSTALIAALFDDLDF
ncbi:helicase-related protein [Pseudomonas lundensis]|uniref:helicase-related protein n=1 Tax=Pseudomonas lundensis TaxID=86185 RepID=UPI0034671ED8